MDIKESLRNVAQKVTHVAARSYRESKGLPQRETYAAIGRRVVDHREGSARLNEAWDRINSDVPRGAYEITPEQEHLEELLSQRGMQPVAHEVRALIGALYNSSEQIAASQVRAEIRKEIAKAGDKKSGERGRLEWKNASLRVYAATHLSIEDTLGDVSGYPTTNRVILLVAPDARSIQARRDVAKRISNVLGSHIVNRERNISERESGKSHEGLIYDAEWEGRTFPFPITREEHEALLAAPQPKIPPLHTEKPYSDTYLVKGRSKNDYHSVWVLRSAGTPPLVVALGQMPREAIESTTSIHGSNLTCIAEIHQNSLTGLSNVYANIDGDGDN